MEFSHPGSSRWAFRATVFKSYRCKRFVGYGDADPSNVSPLVHGAEMRVAETRAVNRALRKAYGIGICSVEEIGSFAEPVPSARETKKLPPQPVNGNNGNHGNYGGPKVRDRLCQLIRQHQLDANLVKSYAVDFCGSAEGLGQIFCLRNQCFRVMKAFQNYPIRSLRKSARDRLINDIACNIIRAISSRGDGFLRARH